MEKETWLDDFRKKTQTSDDCGGFWQDEIAGDGETTGSHVQWEDVEDFIRALIESEREKLISRVGSMYERGNAEYDPSDWNATLDRVIEVLKEHPL